MIRFALVFIIILAVLFWLNVLGPVQENVILPFTSGLAWVCTSLIHMVDGDVIATGKTISSRITGWAVSIEPGCNGVEAVIILASAIFAFPAPWKHRFIGFALGFLAIQGLNIVRIISLFYIGLWERNACVPGAECHTVWFEWFHLYLWQALIILDALVVWLIWLRYLPRTAAPARRAAIA
jgi:exosortase H (IPTLxxWG-CTERM-specific)